MSILSKKSTSNIQAAEVLIGKQLFSPSVHCSYYSCIQRAKYLMIGPLGKEDEVQQVDLDPRSIHKFFIDQIRTELKDRKEVFKSINWYKAITNLRALRIEADYKDVAIDQDKSKKALKTAKEIHTLLNILEQ